MYVAFVLGAILTDTIQLSEEAGKTTEKDRRIVEQLQAFLSNQHSLEVTFQEIQRARSDCRGKCVCTRLGIVIPIFYNLTVLVCLYSFLLLRNMYIVFRW